VVSDNGGKLFVGRGRFTIDQFRHLGADLIVTGVGEESDGAVIFGRQSSSRAREYRATTSSTRLRAEKPRAGHGVVDDVRAHGHERSVTAIRWP